MSLFRLVLVALAAMMLCWVSDAGAVVVRAPGFSIDVRGSVCIIVPAELQDPTECEGLDVVAAAKVDLSAAGRLVRALGIVRESGTRKFLGTFQLIETTHPGEWPDQAAATALSVAFAKDMIPALPPTAKAHAGTAYVDTIGRTRVVRTTLDVDGLAPGSQEEAALGHHEVSAVFIRTGRYVVLFAGNRADAAALKAVSDQSIATLTLDANLRPGKDVSKLVAQLMVGLALGIVMLVAWLAHRRSQRNEQRRRDVAARQSGC